MKVLVDQKPQPASTQLYSLAESVPDWVYLALGCIVVLGQMYCYYSKKNRALEPTNEQAPVIEKKEESDPPKKRELRRSSCQGPFHSNCFSTLIPPKKMCRITDGKSTNSAEKTTNIEEQAEVPAEKPIGDDAIFPRKLAVIAAVGKINWVFVCYMFGYKKKRKAAFEVLDIIKQTMEKK